MIGHSADQLEWTVRLIAPANANLTELEEKLVAVPGVNTVAIEEESAPQAWLTNGPPGKAARGFRDVLLGIAAIHPESM